MEKRRGEGAPQCGAGSWREERGRAVQKAYLGSGNIHNKGRKEGKPDLPDVGLRRQTDTSPTPCRGDNDGAEKYSVSSQE